MAELPRIIPGGLGLCVFCALAPHIYFTKGEANCLQLSVPEGCTRLTLDASTPLGIFTRNYLEPATKIGPAMPEILYDRVIKFSPRP